MGYKLSINNLSIGYRDKVVAENICAEICSGQMVCLIGRNGTGKSTLLKTIAGFLSPLHGGVEFDNRKLETMTKKELARTIGIVLTGRTLGQNLSVEDMVGLGRSPYTGFFGRLTEKDKEIVESSIEMIGIGNLRNRKIVNLSDGEYQKVIIAKTLAQQTPIILLDEPTAFLDFQSKVDVMELALNLAHSEGKIILMTTHDINLAMKIADKLWIMKNKNILRKPSGEEINDFIGEKAAKYI